MIFVSASLGEELAIEALKQGATDYVLKQRLKRLVPAVNRALQEAQERCRSQRAEAARSRNEARLRAVAANLPYGAVFILDRDLRYLLAEGNALEGAGMTSGDLVGKTIWNALDSESAKRYEPYFRQALGGESFSLEHCSHERHYISHGTPLCDERGKVDAVLAVSYDITERKRAELNAEFLATVSQVLVRANSIDEIVQIVGKQLHRYLNTSICAFVEINEGTGQAVVNYDWHQNDVPSLVGVYSLLEFVTKEFLQAAKAGQPLVVRDVAVDPRITDAQRYTALKIGAELNVPLIREGEWKFSLAVFHQAPYDWHFDEIELMRELANRIWAKLERARTEAALRESETRLRLALKTGKLGSWQLDLKTNHLVSSDQCKANYGFLPEADFTHQALFDCIHPDDRAWVQAAVQQAIKQHTDYDVEYRTIWDDGSLHWVLVRGRTVYDADGTPLQMVGMSLDITERKLAEVTLQQTSAELERQVRKFDATLSTITDSVFTFDREGRFLYANQVLLDLWGLSAAEALGKTMADLNYSPTVERQLLNDLQRVFKTGESVRNETSYTNPVGIDRYFEYILSPVFAADCTVESVVGLSRDISDRKLAEAALRQSEEQSRNILESITDAFLSIDENWQIAYVNKAAYTLTGYAPGDLVGKNFWEAFPGLPGSEFEQMHRRVMRDRVAQSLTEFYPVHDRWYEVRTYPAANGVTIYFRNVTEQIKAEEAVRRSEARFRRIFECNMIGMGIWSRSGGITEANDALLDIIGYTRQDLAEGRLNWQEITVPEHADHDGQALAEIAERGVCSSYEKDYIHKQGHRVPILVGAAGFADDPEAGFFFAVDLSERKQIEVALQARNARLNLLSEVANDLLLNEDPKIFLARLFAKLSKHLDLEVFFNYLFEVDRQHLQLHAYGGVSEEIAQFAEALELGQGVCGHVAQCRQPAVVENALESDHPLALPVQSIGIRAYASHPLLVGDRVLGTLGMGTRQRDRFTPDELELMQVVTHQVAAALERSRLVGELLDRAEALAQTNRIKDEFLAVLSHELRTPLNPILGWVRLLQSGKLDAARQKDALATIERNAKLQSQLIEDLLDISRIMQGKLTLNAAPVSLAFVISAAVETVSLAAAAKQIQIRLDLDPHVAPISGDAARLGQVVWNLLTNAVKFTPNGGQVTIQLRQVESDGNSSAQIRVIDTGKGISPQFVPHVFEYFRQEDGSTTRRFGGLGLGLAIVRQIVELHGGTVKAESDGEEQGATFIVQLPTLQQASLMVIEPIQTEDDSETRLKNVQILLVDDDTDTRELEAFLLEQHGATVIATASGSEALRAIEQSTPDLIVSDIGMAEIDGYMLIEQIRSRPPDRGGQIPAIALTAYAAEIDRQRAMQAGFQLHLTKPLEPEQFVSAIVSLLKPKQV